jgi:hypothetical protein
MKLVLISVSRARATSAAPGYGSQLFRHEQTIVDLADITVTASGSPQHCSVGYIKTADLVTIIHPALRSTKPICLHHHSIAIP